MAASLIDRLTPEEIGDALFLVGVFECSAMTPANAGDWRRRVLARAAFLGLPADSRPADESGPAASAASLP